MISLRSPERLVGSLNCWDWGLNLVKVTSSSWECHKLNSSFHSNKSILPLPAWKGFSGGKRWLCQEQVATSSRESELSPCGNLSQEWAESGEHQYIMGASRGELRVTPLCHSPLPLRFAIDLYLNIFLSALFVVLPLFTQRCSSHFLGQVRLYGNQFATLLELCLYHYQLCGKWNMAINEQVEHNFGTCCCHHQSCKGTIGFHWASLLVTAALSHTHPTYFAENTMTSCWCHRSNTIEIVPGWPKMDHWIKSVCELPSRERHAFTGVGN